MTVLPFLSYKRLTNCTRYMTFIWLTEMFMTNLKIYEKFNLYNNFNRNFANSIENNF